MADVTRSIEGTDKSAAKIEPSPPVGNMDALALMKEGQTNTPNQAAKPGEPTHLVVPANVDGLKSNNTAACPPSSDVQMTQGASKSANSHGVAKGDPIMAEIGRANEAIYRKDLLDRYGGAKGLAAAQKKDMQKYDKFFREQAARDKRDHVGEF